MADLGEGPGGGGQPPLFWVKKEEMTEGRKAGWASKIEPGPLLSSKSGSATDAVLNLDYWFLTLISKTRNEHKYFYSQNREAIWSDKNLLILPTSLTQQTLDAAEAVVVPSFVSVRSWRVADNTVLLKTEV